MSHDDAKRQSALNDTQRSGALDAEWCVDAFWRVNPGRNATVPSLYLLDFAREVLRVHGSTALSESVQPQASEAVKDAIRKAKHHFGQSHALPERTDEVLEAIAHAANGGSKAPRGWKPVPVKPIPAIYTAWRNAYDKNGTFDDCYAAMLAAVPSPNGDEEKS